MNAQIDQNEKTQGAFIMYGNVLFIRGKVKKLSEKRWKKWLVNLRLRSTGARVPQQWRHVQTTYWTTRHAVQWWRLREVSLQEVSRQRGVSPGYPLFQWNGNLLAAQAASRVACRRACILIGLICSTINRCRFIQKCPKSAYWSAGWSIGRPLIDTLHKEGKSQRVITEKRGCSQSAVINAY